VLKVSGMQTFYDKVQALWDVSFEVNEGEYVALIGPNGAGKSTSLKSISGLLPIAGGEIEFLGQRIDPLDASDIPALGLVLIPEGRRLFGHMTVEENLLMGSYVARAKKQRQESLKSVYELFPILEDREKQLARTLSGGEQQMLAIGRGLMSRPRLLMLDEPSLGLAPKLVELVFETLEKINDTGITLLLVEQNIASALQHCDRAYLLENGRITKAGSGDELLADAYVKEAYLGL
jgi:branched-chain amino acid transport system ATP-binding protein